MRKGVIQLPQAKYQVTLAVDGKHAVSVQSDDPAAVTEGLVWANDIYKKLQRLGQSNGASRPVELSVRANPPQASEPEEAPLCGIHQVPMIWQPGRKGYFWSCHEQNVDGTWCSYRPPRKSAAPLPL